MIHVIVISIFLIVIFGLSYWVYKLEIDLDETAERIKLLEKQEKESLK